MQYSDIKEVRRNIYARPSVWPNFFDELKILNSWISVLATLGFGYSSFNLILAIVFSMCDN